MAAVSLVKTVNQTFVLVSLSWFYYLTVIIRTLFIFKLSARLVLVQNYLKVVNFSSILSRYFDAREEMLFSRKSHYFASTVAH